MVETSEPIYFAVIGVGHIGSRHAHMIWQNPQAKLVALVDVRIREELLLGDIDVPLYENIEDMLMHHPKIDVVSIATPNGFHAQHAIQILSSGSNVLVEKPMALSTEDCDAMIDTAEKHSKHIFCVMQNRFSPPSQWLKSILEDNLLGEIYQVQVVCYWNRDHRYYKIGHWHGTADLDGGVLFTQFSHFIDMLYWLLGPIDIDHAVFSNFNHEHLSEFDDSGIALFSFGQRGKGSLNFSTSLANKNFESSLTLIAEKGTVKLGGQYMNTIEYCDIPGYTLPIIPKSAPANHYGPYTGSAANHHFVIQEVIDNLSHNKRCITNAKDGRAVVGIIEKLHLLKK
ncbi:MAG: oxidoreductase [Flavobacteriales bacterium]|nr:Gfo/Idh/MocA family oxidoreductase [Flavobacteriaceae bacterium]PHX93239.1 MAG: oxidoreductase [Flavobacteriales bacterium]